MNVQELDLRQYQPSVGGKYYPELGIWVWDKALSLVSEGKLKQEQFNHLLSMACAVAKLWNRQQGNTYAPDVTREEIKLAFEHDDFFASHFSVGVKANGILRGVSYIEAYPAETETLIRTIESALHADIFASYPKFITYLQTVLHALRSPITYGRRPQEWVACDIALAEQDSPVFMYLHPTESYWDTTQEKFADLMFEEDDPWKYFFEGKAFIENPLVSRDYVEKVKTYILGKYKDVILSNSRISFIDMIVIAGGNASKPNRGQNIPNDPEIRQNHGKQIFMYANTILHRGKNQYLPIKNKYFVYSLVTEEEFINGGLSHTLNHEIAHNAERFSSVQWLEEMKASLLSLHSVAGLESNGLLGYLGTTRNAVYEAEIANHLDLFTQRNEQLAKYYYIGENIMLNFWVKYGAVKLHYLSDGMKLEIDYDKMEEAINLLTEELLRLQDSQQDLDYSEKVEAFRNRYFSEQIFFDLGLEIPAETKSY